MMGKFSTTVVVCMLLITGPVVAQRTPTVAERTHITGCEDGDLLVPVVNMWDSPDMRRIVGRLSGDGRADQGLSCQGAVVIAHEIRMVRGRVFIRIQTVVTGDFGWVTDSFIGRRFDTSRCEAFFGETPAQVSRCVG